MPWPLVILIVTGCGAAIGLFMGILVGYIGLNSLIVSLGVGSTIQGIVLLYSNGEVIFQGISKPYQLLGQTRLFGFIPLPFLYALIAGIVLWFLLTLRPIGRRLYAIGGSPEAARIIGINVKRYVAGSFVVSSTVAAFAGCPAGRPCRRGPSDRGAIAAAAGIRGGLPRRDGIPAGFL